MNLRPQPKTLAQLASYATGFEQMSAALAGHIENYVKAFKSIEGVPGALAKKAHHYLSDVKAFHLGCREFLHLTTECNKCNYVERLNELNLIFTDFQYKLARKTELLAELQNDFLDANLPRVILMRPKKGSLAKDAPKRK